MRHKVTWPLGESWGLNRGGITLGPVRMKPPLQSAEREKNSVLQWRGLPDPWPVYIRAIEPKRATAEAEG